MKAVIQSPLIWIKRSWIASASPFVELGQRVGLPPDLVFVPSYPAETDYARPSNYDQGCHNRHAANDD